MLATPRHTLWFVNQSLRGGQVCIYHDPANTDCNQAGLQPLAWRVASANPQVRLCFRWQTGYGLVWFDHAMAEGAHQCIDAGAALLGRNAYGCDFTPLPEREAHGQLIVQSDRSIAAGGPVSVGLGMDGSAAFSLPCGPNLTTVFTPVPTSQLAYWITFGAYGLQPADALDPGLLNLPGRIRFPDRVDTMTAVLDEQNAWTVYPGPPA